LEIGGYTLATELRKDREDTQNGLGGGLLIYVKTGLAIKANEKFDGNPFIQFSAFTILSRCPLHVIVVYRPPNSGRQNVQYLCELLQNLDQNTLVIGDFNLPDIQWEAKIAGPKGRPLLDTVLDQNLDQLVNFATHDKGNILDLVITNCSENILSVTNHGKLGNSDHCVIETLVDGLIKKKHQMRQVLCWDKADWDTMRLEMETIDWDRLFANKNVEENWLSFRNKLMDCAERNIPRRMIKVVARQRWVTNEIIKLIRMKKRRWREYKLYKTTEARIAYEEVEKELKKKIKKAKRKKERDLVNSEDRNGRKFTDYIKAKTKVRTGIGPLKRPDGTMTTNAREMANILNEFFSSVFIQEDLSNLPTKDRETNKIISDVIVSERLIVKKIDKLKKDSASGPDNIHPRILKELRNNVAYPLAKIYRQSLDSGEVPQDWKKAKVVPIFKKGTKSDPGNYRPVSLTSVPCKILESIIKDEIMNHLEAEKLIKDSQHGFMPGRSCTTNLTIFLNELTKALDAGKAADVFYLDFAKAFDKVAHQRLILKVESKGIEGKISRWLEEWLKNRTQTVVVEGEESNESEVESGVPQGTVMGPPLFNIYIDDIDDFVTLIELLIKFADDNKGLKIIESEADRVKLQKTLDALCEWAKKWSMEFNVQKCKIMHVGRNNPGYKYSMNGVELKEIDEETDVGVVVHKSLKPARQVEKAANTANAVLRLVLRNFHYRDRKVYLKLYKQYVRPHLEFCGPAWTPWTVADIAKLENVQKKAISMVSGLNGMTYEERCRELGLQTLEQRRQDQDMAQVHRFSKKVGNIGTDQLFEKAAIREGPVTRQSGDAENFKVPAARLEIRKNFFTVRTVQKWNELPKTVKSAKNGEIFKRELQKWRENGGRPQ
jgi:hypothetical protein